MAMTWIWTGMVVLSLVFGLITGRLDAVADAAMDGAASAVELSVSMAGVLCLWSGVMEIMNACGLSAGLARVFRPVLRIFTRLAGDQCAERKAQCCGEQQTAQNLFHDLTPLIIHIFFSSEPRPRNAGLTAVTRRAQILLQLCAPYSKFTAIACAIRKRASKYSYPHPLRDCIPPSGRCRPYCR